jgi:hypothetical protein
VVGEKTYIFLFLNCHTYNLTFFCLKKNNIFIIKIAYSFLFYKFLVLLVAIVIGFERTSLGQSHVLGLVVGQLGQVGIKGRQVEAGHKLVHQLGHQVNIGLISSRRSVKQFWKTFVSSNNEYFSRKNIRILPTLVVCLHMHVGQKYQNNYQ